MRLSASRDQTGVDGALEDPGRQLGGGELGPRSSWRGWRGGAPCAVATIPER